MGKIFFRQPLKRFLAHLLIRLRAFASVVFIINGHWPYNWGIYFMLLFFHKSDECCFNIIDGVVACTTL